VTPFGPVWQLLFFAVLLWSAWHPHDYLTWLLEVLPALVAWGVLWFSRHRFPLTPLLSWLVLLHCLILMLGGHYTYAEVPLGDWVADWTGGTRNNYDKLGHLAQGFVPALAARELLIRLRVVPSPHWRFTLITLSILGISAFYELIEWWAALLSSEAAEAFLGTQGYVWDTQSDMLLALIGALLAQIVLARPHDRQLTGLAHGTR
jgi:putative membrane protein